MTQKVSYNVPGMTCNHCKHSVLEEVSQVDGVDSVDVDLASKVVTVSGENLDDAVLRRAIEEAGYEAV